MTAMDDPGRKLSEALRARAGQSGVHAFPPSPQPGPSAAAPVPRTASASMAVPMAQSGQYSPVHQSSVQAAVRPSHPLAMAADQQESGRWQETPSTGGRRAAPRSPMNQVWWALAVALLGGALLGCALALLSVLVPGLLPAMG